MSTCWVPQKWKLVLREEMRVYCCVKTAKGLLIKLSPACWNGCPGCFVVQAHAISLRGHTRTHTHTNTSFFPRFIWQIEQNGLLSIIFNLNLFAVELMRTFCQDVVIHCRTCKTSKVILLQHEFSSMLYSYILFLRLMFLGSACIWKCII